MVSTAIARRREARIDGILDAATALVMEAGLDALTLQRLGAELGVATTALYRYFPGKTELVVALQVRAIASLAADVGAAIAAVTAGPDAALARVWAALDVFLDGPRRAPARHHLIDAFLSAPAPQLDEASLADVEAVLGPLLADVAACFDAAADAGALSAGDGALRTRVLWAAAHGVHHLRRRDRIEPRARQSPALAREVVEVMLRGWGASPAALVAARAEVQRMSRRATRAAAQARAV